MSATSPVEIVELPAETRAGGVEPARAHAPRLAPRPAVYVLFTTRGETLAALRVASDLAHSLRGSIRLVDFRVVPVGAPVERPTGRSPLENDGFLERARADGIDVHAHVYVCRDARCAVRQALPRDSLVLIGGRRRWWRTRAERWRRILERQGHLVVLVDPRRHVPGRSGL